MIPRNRKERIKFIAESIAGEFRQDNITMLHDIADFERLAIHYDNYEDAFDGMLLYDRSEFHIHLNTDLGNAPDSKKGRFTLAHELGHFFLDEHRLGLKYGLLDPHASFFNVDQRLPIEAEANFFASCLIMPQTLFQKRLGGRQFSFQTIFALSDSFQVSIPAAVIRFSEIGTHPIFATYSVAGVVRWWAKTDDFPNWRSRFSIGNSLPIGALPPPLPDSMQQLSNVEFADPDTWFVVPESDNRADRKFHEQCYYSDAFGYAIHLLWFD